MEEKLDQILKKLGEHDKRFDGLDRRFGGLENRFDGLEIRFIGLENRVGGLEDRMGGLENHSNVLEKQTNSILSLLLDTRAEVRDINKRLVRVESAVDTTYNKIDGFLGILHNYSDELTAHAAAHRRYEARFEELV